jgi:hypothetical protein
MCAVIIAAEKMREHEKLGFNCCSPDWKEGMEDWDEDQIGEILTEENMRSIDKISPFGPTCDFNGKIVPSFVCWSPKGSIMSYLLAAMLKNGQSRTVQTLQWH